MTKEELLAAALSFEPGDRAELAARLLKSLETLSPKEVEQLWVAEAERRNAEMNDHPERGRAVEDVLRDARARLA